MHDASPHRTFRERLDCAGLRFVGFRFFFVYFFFLRRKILLEVSHSNCLCHREVKGHLSPSGARPPRRSLGRTRQRQQQQEEEEEEEKEEEEDGQCEGRAGPYCFTTIQCRF